MKHTMVTLIATLVIGCGNKKHEDPSCESTATHLVVLNEGRHASFMTKKERTARAKKWIAKCESMSEATRACVLAATTKEQADGCQQGGSAAPAYSGAHPKAAWVVYGGDDAYQDVKFVALAPDGDVIAVGEVAGTLTLGGKVVAAQPGNADVLLPGAPTDVWVARLSPAGAVRWLTGIGGPGLDHAMELDIRADNSAELIVRSDSLDTKKLSRVLLAADGTTTTTPLVTHDVVDVTALHPNGDIVVGRRMREPTKGSRCAALGYVVERLGPDSKPLWSRCNDDIAEVVRDDAPMRIAAGAEGTTAMCAGFYGSLSWGGKVSPEGNDKKRTFVMALDARGDVRWVNYISGAGGAFCHALAITDGGAVAAILFGTAPGSALSLWNPDGTQRWNRSCADLVGEEGKCEFSAIAADDTNVVVAARSESGIVLATIDSETGTNKSVRLFNEGTRIDALATRKTAIVFGTAFFGKANFGTGEIESTPGRGKTTMDVLIGHL